MSVRIEELTARKVRIRTWEVKEDALRVERGRENGELRSVVVASLARKQIVKSMHQS